MSARVDQFVPVSLPTPLRWLGGAAAVVAAVTAIAKLRERARRPSVAPMSDDWLRRHAADRTYQSQD